MSEEEKKKREEEKAKKILEENEEVNTVAKRKGNRIYIHGSNFIKSEFTQLRFSIDNQHFKYAKPIFKNSRLLGSVIPNMSDDVPIGQHHVTDEITINGQQFTENGLHFFFQQVDPKMTEEELRKLEEDELKNQKKAPAKKK